MSFTYSTVRLKNNSLTSHPSVSVPEYPLISHGSSEVCWGISLKPEIKLNFRKRKEKKR